METVKHLWGNYTLNCVLASWITAQVLKTLIAFVLSKKFNPERLVGAGGMPSAHTASVCALVIAVARQAGVGTPEFGIAFLLAAIVMYDAMGVRRETGHHAKVLNRMMDQLDEKEDGEADEQEANELKEFVGHTPIEVLAGALLGILIAIILPK